MPISGVKDSFVVRRGDRFLKSPHELDTSVHCQRHAQRKSRDLEEPYANTRCGAGKSHLYPTAIERHKRRRGLAREQDAG